MTHLIIGRRQDYNLKHHLAKYLPADGSYLPKEPVVLSKDEELELRRLIREDLTGFNTSKLKDVYLELTGFDRHLTGCISYENLLFSLLRAKVGISAENLRLVASLFITSNCGGENQGNTRMVNYEKVLSFISAAQKPNGPLIADLRNGVTLQTSAKNTSPMPATPAMSIKSETDKRSNFNIITQEDHSPRSKKFPYGNRDNSKLLRMIEQALVISGEDLDYDKIYAIFRNFDRGHRDMLSRDQIKMLAMKCRIPLQESLLDSIINKLDSSNGQYSWMQFLEFLERVQPANTGLHMPESKRPTDYAKHYPEPSADWPKNTAISSNTGENLLTMPDKRDSDQNPPNQSSRGQHAQEISNREEARLRTSGSEIRYQPETGNQFRDNGQQRQEGLEPWFERFMKLAKALYDNDVDANGVLSMEEVTRLIRLHNETLALGFDEDTMRRTVQYCAMNDNNVPIDNLLKVLSVHHS
ncbi:hypothetical protein LSH36_456g01012 [Paralvinella palmiformis]|uniref:EF-hand domain-containing protein n=1 Tax=Paralvinella palmiformis TaxID=53620 RepID=A0AAD9JA78_9ANNE|nr:hypothetical protein LSH36_456g01012 [Paralvinella palmiformis]